MKRYKFPLDQVLEIRQNVETQRQGEFIQAMRVVDENADILERIEEDQQQFLERYHVQQRVGLQPNECIRYHQYFHALVCKACTHVPHRMDLNMYQENLSQNPIIILNLWCLDGSSFT